MDDRQECLSYFSKFVVFSVTLVRGPVEEFWIAACGPEIEEGFATVASLFTSLVGRIRSPATMCPAPDRVGIKPSSQRTRTTGSTSKGISAITFGGSLRTRAAEK